MGGVAPKVGKGSPVAVSSVSGMFLRPQLRLADITFPFPQESPRGWFGFPGPKKQPKKRFWGKGILIRGQVTHDFPVEASLDNRGLIKATSPTSN